MKKELTRRWRKSGFGRLYWKRQNWKWRNFWDSDDIAAIRDGGVSIHIKSMDALKNLVEEVEANPQK
jgi:hypothetical protein